MEPTYQTETDASGGSCFCPDLENTPVRRVRLCRTIEKMGRMDTFSRKLGMINCSQYNSI